MSVIEGSVYFEVKTLIKAATEKRAERPKNNFVQLDDIERDRKVERTPKELKSLKKTLLFAATLPRSENFEMATSVFFCQKEISLLILN